ncbi:MAG TPA: cyclase family protein [Pseudolysinimonas sp.]|nr:cyclase family protein [Pseudolysinimonas sp.]
MSAPDLNLVNEMALKYRNWGKWGAEDQVGALNYITPEHVTRAAALVRRGVVFSLALPLDTDGPQTGAYGRINPLHTMLQDGGDIISGAQDHMLNRYTDDAIYMPLQSSTQWDGLAHIFHDGQMYNGHGPEQVTSAAGARINDITNQKDKIVGRGVLLDMPRFLGKPWLPEGYAIQADELEGCAAAQGVEVGEGDIALVRTGAIAQVRDRGSWGTYAAGPAPGLGVSTADFFAPRHVSAVVTDTWGLEPQPNETTDIYQPLHVILLVNAGMLLGEMFDLEALAEDCAADGVYEFMLVAAPLTVTGGVGSPLNPQAIK